jgi:hypothetical protein
LSYHGFARIAILTHRQSPMSPQRYVAPPRKPASRRLRLTPRRPELSIDQILAWADAYHERTGEWPTSGAGRIVETADDSWRHINDALSRGSRGLPRQSGYSLARLLEKRRGVRNSRLPPRLTVPQILRWAKAHRQRTGSWPIVASGAVIDAPGETWTAIQIALIRGGRGLPGGSSLPGLLLQEFGARNTRSAPPLSEREILKWCDAHKKRTGQWPTQYSGDVPESPGDSWQMIDMCLRRGLRGCVGETSLPRLLAAKRGRRTRTLLPRLSVTQVLKWCDAHHDRTGAWPGQDSGPIVDAPGETWRGVETALRRGRRGLPEGLSIARLLAKKRNVPNKKSLPKLTARQIVKWAKEHKRRTGAWPTLKSGPVIGAPPNETWARIGDSLIVGTRGLPGGQSLSRLLRNEPEGRKKSV